MLVLSVIAIGIPSAIQSSQDIFMGTDPGRRRSFHSFSTNQPRNARFLVSSGQVTVNQSWWIQREHSRTISYLNRMQYLWLFYNQIKSAVWVWILSDSNVTGGLLSFFKQAQRWLTNHYGHDTNGTSRQNSCESNATTADHNNTATAEPGERKISTVYKQRWRNMGRSTLRFCNGVHSIRWFNWSSVPCKLLMVASRTLMATGAV